MFYFDLLHLSPAGSRQIVRDLRGFDEIDAALEMTGYYSLAYVPAHGGDRRVHKIDVKVWKDAARLASGKPVKSLIVRHRKGYRDKGDDVRMSERGTRSSPRRARPSTWTSRRPARARPSIWSRRSRSARDATWSSPAR